MTPAELKKEAEQILGLLDSLFLIPDDPHKQFRSVIVNALRAVHEVGFNEAKEKAANMAACTFRNLYDGENDLAKRIHVAVGREIRAIKSGDL